MKLLHLSIASIIVSGIGLLLLLGITLQSHTRLEAAKTELNELFELRHRIDHLSVATDSLLLFGAGPELWRRLQAEAEDIQRRLRQQGEKHPEALKAAHRVQVLLDAVANLAAPVGSSPTPEGSPESGPDSAPDRTPASSTRASDPGSRSAIEPPPMTERTRIILSQIASHGVMLDIALDALLRERRQAIAQEANQIAIRLAGSAILFGLLCISAFGLIYRRVAAPVRSLTQTLEHLYQGDLDARAVVKGRDELALLAAIPAVPHPFARPPFGR
ncbi:HAMP domain-containing protein, partial [Halochromatium sp.]